LIIIGNEVQVNRPFNPKIANIYLVWPKFLI